MSGRFGSAQAFSVALLAVARLAAVISLATVISLALSHALAAPRPVLYEISERVFSRPHDLVLGPAQALLYVADVGNHSVKVLEPDSLKVVGEIGKGELDSPHDVAFDAKGRLLVADSGNDRIAIYEISGNGGSLAGELTGELDSPEGVVEGPAGRVFVTSAESHTVTVFVRGLPERTFGSGGRGPGNFIRPHDIEVDSQGRIYVTDPGNNRIHILAADLKTIHMLAAPAFKFNEPKYLAFDPKGRLYVADQHNNEIKIFDRNLRRLDTIPPSRGGRARRLNWPEGVASDGERIWVSDTYHDQILLYRLRE